MEGSADIPKPRSLLDKILGRNKTTTQPVAMPAQPATQPSVDQQIATHQATIDSAQGKQTELNTRIQAMSVDPIAADKPIRADLEAQHAVEEARIADARASIANLQRAPEAAAMATPIEAAPSMPTTPQVEQPMQPAAAQTNENLPPNVVPFPSPQAEPAAEEAKVG